MKLNKEYLKLHRVLQERITLYQTVEEKHNDNVILSDIVYGTRVDYGQYNKCYRIELIDYFYYIEDTRQEIFEMKLKYKDYIRKKRQFFSIFKL